MLYNINSINECDMKSDCSYIWCLSSIIYKCNINHRLEMRTYTTLANDCLHLLMFSTSNLCHVDCVRGWGDVNSVGNREVEGYRHSNQRRHPECQLYSSDTNIIYKITIINSILSTFICRYYLSIRINILCLQACDSNSTCVDMKSDISGRSNFIS